MPIQNVTAIQPLYDRILVRRAEAQKVSAGGIIIPDNAKEKPVEALVLAVGEGRLLDAGGIRPLRVKVGDRVLFGKYTGSEVELDGEKELVILREDDVLCVLTGERER